MAIHKTKNSQSKNNKRSYPVRQLHISIVSKGEIKYTNNPGDAMYSAVTIVNNTVHLKVPKRLDFKTFMTRKIIVTVQ